MFFVFIYRAIAASAPIAQFSTNCDAFARIVTSDYRYRLGLSEDFINKILEFICGICYGVM